MLHSVVSDLGVRCLPRSQVLGARHNRVKTNLMATNKPRHEKTRLRGFQPGKIQTGLHSYTDELVLKFWI